MKCDNQSWPQAPLSKQALLKGIALCNSCRLCMCVWFTIYIYMYGSVAQGDIKHSSLLDTPLGHRSALMSSCLKQKGLWPLAIYRPNSKLLKPQCNIDRVTAENLRGEAMNICN